MLRTINFRFWFNFILHIFQDKGLGPPKPGCWSNPKIPDVKSVTYDVPLSTLKLCNPHWEKCVCVYCHEVMVGPILFRGCDHGSCRKCFFDENFRKPMITTVCNKCSSPVSSEDDVIPSGVLQTMIDNLNVKCTEGMLRPCSYGFNSFHLI